MTVGNISKTYCSTQMIEKKKDELMKYHLNYDVYLIPYISKYI